MWPLVRIIEPCPLVQSPDLIIADANHRILIVSYYIPSRSAQRCTLPPSTPFGLTQPYFYLVDAADLLSLRDNRYDGARLLKLLILSW